MLNDLGLTAGGQPIPWVLYHITPLPQDLIIPSRNKIEQITSYQLEPDLTVKQATGLENSVNRNSGAFPRWWSRSALRHLTRP